MPESVKCDHEANRCRKSASDKASGRSKRTPTAWSDIETGVGRFAEISGGYTVLVEQPAEAVDSLDSARPVEPPSDEVGDWRLEVGPTVRSVVVVLDELPEDRRRRRSPLIGTQSRHSTLTVRTKRSTKASTSATVAAPERSVTNDARTAALSCASSALAGHAPTATSPFL
jgi:hypothetical protein